MSTEHTPKGYNLLFGSPAVTGNLALERKHLDLSLDQNKLDPLINEYREIYNLMQTLAGSERLIVLNSELNWGDSPDSEKAKNEFYELTNDIPQQVGPFSWNNYYNLWPRDAYSYIGGEIYADPNAFKKQKDFQLFPTHPTSSFLGEGGAVLSRKNIIFVGLETSEEAEEDLDTLSTLGINFGILPIADPTIHDISNHVDGVATLIEDKSGDLILLVAKSYYEQGFDASKKISKAVKEASTGLLVIDDHNFPSLAFNLVQFDDLTICMTSGAPHLQKALIDLVGSDAVQTTKIPIELLPKRASGSIRCLTNLIPDSIAQPKPQVK